MARNPQLKIRLSREKGQTPKDILRDPLRLPVVIGDFEFSESAQHEDFTTIGAGEFSSPLGGDKPRLLRALSQEMFTLSWDPSWMTYPGQEDRDVRSELVDILRSHKPFQFLAILGGPGGDGEDELRMTATLRGMQRRLTRGETDTRYYTLDFKEWREARVSRKGKGKDKNLPTKHKLTAKDTLRSLAKHYYGQGNLWRWIADANGIKKWGSEDPIVKMKRFKEGDRIKIPKPPGESEESSPKEDDPGTFLTDDG